MIHVLLANELFVVRAGLRRFFETTKYLVIGEVATSDGLHSEMKRLRPHLVVLDESQPSFRGVTESLERETVVIHFHATDNESREVFLRRIEMRTTTKKSRLSRKKTKPNDSLTRREQEVLTLIAEGWSNKIIAKRLGIALETVKEHVRNLLRKSSTTNRTQAVLWAVRGGLVSPGVTDIP